MTALTERDPMRAAGVEDPGGAAATTVPLLHRSAVVVAALLAVAAAATSATIVVSGLAPTVAGAVLLAVGVAAGDLLEIELPFRKGGSAVFGLSEAALAAGLLIVPPPDVALGMAAGIIPPLLLDRTAPGRRLANLATYAAGGSCAALTVSLIGVSGSADLSSVLAATAGVGCFLAISAVAITRLIALDGGRSWGGLLREVLPIALTTSVGSAGLGVLAVVLWAPAPWAVLLLVVPVVLLHTGSRLSVRARVERERAAAFVTAERRLSDAGAPEAVAAALAEGASLLLGGTAAVWTGGTWHAAVPAGSGPCPVDPELDVVLVTEGSALGPRVDGRAAAIGYGSGVLVCWDAVIDRDARDWLQRLSRSGRLHLDRAVANLALEQERATVRAVVDGTADGIYVVDGRAVIRLWNPGMARLAGVAPDRALGRGVDDVLGLGPWSRPGVRDVVREGDAVWRVSIAAVSHAAAGSGRTDLAVAVVHDVTAERRAARMRDDMLAVVSHELRTPLTPIKASAQLLQLRWDRIDADRRTALLAQIDERASHLARLVDDLLLAGQLSATDRPTPSVRREPVDLAAHLRRNVEHLASARTQHRLCIDAPAALPLVTDATRFRQIVDNLVDNACKFSPEGTAVLIELRPDAGGAVLVVRDEGRGIPAADRDRVFERFARVEDPLHMTTSGAGLGLYIVRAIVHALGGDITLDSQIGRGTTVTVTLPRQPARCDEAAAVA